MDGKNDMNKVNNKSNGNNSFPSQPNKFINNYKKNSSGSSNLKDTVQRGQQQNDLINKQNESLKKNISKQAVENPKESNIVKGKNSNTESNGLSKNMAVNKAKNLMNSIHSNKKKNNDDSNDTNNQDGKKESTADSLKKKIFSSFITSSTGIPKPLADKFSSKAVDKSKIIKRAMLIISFSLIFMFLILIVSADDDDDNSSETSSSLSDFYSDSISDEELYNYFVENGYVDSGVCINSDGSFDEDCPFISFMNEIKEGTDNQNQFLYIFYSISYNREYSEYIEKSDELAALLDNKNSLSTYLNGEYKKNYRGDLEESFDLYDYVSKLASSGGTITSKGYSVCETITVDGVEKDGTTVDDVKVNFEDYVAGVVKHEIGFVSDSSYGNKYDEAIKALAIAARTYAYYVTDGCKSSISNNNGQQTFSEIDLSSDKDKKIADLVSQVPGIMLKDSTGSLLLTQYDSFCFSSLSNNTYHMFQGNIDIPVTWTNKMNILGMGTNQYKTRDGNMHTSGWIRLNCPCDNSKHGNNIDKNNKACTIEENGSVKYLDGGHGNGMSQYGALYLSEEQNLKYDEILKRFYGDDIQFEQPSDEFEINSETGFKMRISRAQRDNKFFYSSESIEFINAYEGECVWYAEGRADEILSNWGVNKKYTALGNGGEFCQKARKVNYQVNEDVNDVTEGSIISWMYNTYGHVAIVEKVNRDSSGNVTSIEISQGGLGYNNPLYKPSFEYKGRTIMTSIFKGNNWGFVSNNDYGGMEVERRQVWCEAFGTGCQNYGQILERGSIANYNQENVVSWCTIPLSQFK